MPPRLTISWRDASAARVMPPQVILESAHPRVVGSFGNAASLATASPEFLEKACDIAEIRLDLLAVEGVEITSRPWSRLGNIPLLFTARRGDEGGAGTFGTTERSTLLMGILDEASLVDIELASAAEMASTLTELKARKIPWVASWHDFAGHPESFDKLPGMAHEAALAGAACFKAAIRLHQHDDIERLLEVFASVSDIPLSLMGMGPLASESRLRCAAAGSVLNYGYVGDAATAPGQCSAEELKQGIEARGR